MSLLDTTDKNDPNAKSSMMAGAEKGASIGSMFGPMGTLYGTFIGAGIGALQGNDERKRARRKATNQSYQFANEAYSYAAESREAVATKYSRDLSDLTARSHARGGRSNSAFEVQKGKLLEERDSALRSVDTEMAQFRAGPNYEWFVKDYERVTGITQTGRGQTKEEEATFQWTIGGSSRSSRELPAAYDESMINRMAVRSTRDRGQTKVLEAYMERVRPTIEQYERLVFGNEEDRKAYADYMNTRIDSANKWYAAETAISAKEQEERKRQQLAQDNKK